MKLIKIKFFGFLFLFIIFITAFSQTIRKVNWKNNSYNLYPVTQNPQFLQSYYKNFAEEIIQYSSVKNPITLNGLWIQFFEPIRDSIPSKIFQLKNGQVIDTVLFFHSNGVIKSKFVRNDSLCPESYCLNGLYQSWYETKIKKDSCFYFSSQELNNVKIGKVKYWYENGNISFIAENSLNGQINGKLIKFYKNNHPKEITTFSEYKTEDGSYKSYKNGILTEYYENGTPKFSLNYLKGELLDTIQCYYHSNGLKKACGPIINKHGNPYIDGEWKTWNKLGQLTSKGKYQLTHYIDCSFFGYEKRYYSYKVGEWEYFNDKGELIAKGKYKTKNKKVNTRCKGGDKMKYGAITNDWFLLNKNDEETLILIKSNYFKFDD